MHRNLHKGQDLKVSTSDAKVRRAFQRLAISFQVEFLQADLLGSRAITAPGKRNLRGVTITLVLD